MSDVQHQILSNEKLLRLHKLSPSQVKALKLQEPHTASVCENFNGLLFQSGPSCRMAFSPLPIQETDINGRGRRPSNCPISSLSQQLTDSLRRCHLPSMCIASSQRGCTCILTGLDKITVGKREPRKKLGSY